MKISKISIFYSYIILDIYFEKKNFEREKDLYAIHINTNIR